MNAALLASPNKNARRASMSNIIGSPLRRDSSPASAAISSNVHKTPTGPHQNNRATEPPVASSFELNNNKSVKQQKNKGLLAKFLSKTSSRNKKNKDRDLSATAEQSSVFSSLTTPTTATTTISRKKQDLLSRDATNVLGGFRKQREARQAKRKKQVAAAAAAAAGFSSRSRPKDRPQEEDFLGSLLVFPVADTAVDRHEAAVDGGRRMMMTNNLPPRLLHAPLPRMIKHSTASRVVANNNNNKSSHKNDTETMPSRPLSPEMDCSTTMQEQEQSSPAAWADFLGHTTMLSGRHDDGHWDNMILEDFCSDEEEFFDDPTVSASMMDAADTVIAAAAEEEDPDMLISLSSSSSSETDTMSTEKENQEEEEDDDDDDVPSWADELMETSTLDSPNHPSDYNVGFYKADNATDATTTMTDDSLPSLETAAAAAAVGTTMIEIAPNVSLPLRSSHETAAFVASGNIAETVCLSCQAPLHCVNQAEFILCPSCRVIEPLLDAGMAGGGVALGFLPHEYQQWKKDLLLEK